MEMNYENVADFRDFCREVFFLKSQNFKFNHLSTNQKKIVTSYTQVGNRETLCSIFKFFLESKSLFYRKFTK